MLKRLSRRDFAAALVLAGCTRSMPTPRKPPAPDAASGREAEIPVPPPRATAKPATSAPPTESEPIRHRGWPLLDRFPRLREIVPRVTLADLPTPVEHASALGERLGVPSLYVKRDDLTAREYGGGKTRKLELLLAEAIQQKRRHLVTSGAVGSNHAVATAIYGQRYGLPTTLLLMPQAPSADVRRNLLADFYHGADMHLIGTQRAVAATIARLVESAQGQNRPYVVPVGGTSPLGNLAYVNAALELENQVRAGAIPEPDRIYVAMGTMGCAVGLALGLRLTELRSRLVAVRVSNIPTSTRARFDALLEETVAWIRQREQSFPLVSPANLGAELRSGYLGRGYAQPTAKGRRALELVRHQSELNLELTYTAKTFAALMDEAQRAPHETFLFWHTHSHSLPDVGDADPRALPRAFRPYFPGAARSG